MQYLITITRIRVPFETICIIVGNNSFYIKWIYLFSMVFLNFHLFWQLICVFLNGHITIGSHDHSDYVTKVGEGWMGSHRWILSTAMCMLISDNWKLLAQDQFYYCSFCILPSFCHSLGGTTDLSVSYPLLAIHWVELPVFLYHTPFLCFTEQRATALSDLNIFYLKRKWIERGKNET